ncbi:MAG: putative glycoside hydrolase [Elusimicrobiota bacterium]|jgi:hypothetical protein|nr:putative glycoside hydrolase [Elusimicrobiota bacterium]
MKMNTKAFKYVLALILMFLAATFPILSHAQTQKNNLDVMAITLESPNDSSPLTEGLADTIVMKMQPQETGKFIRGIHLTSMMILASKQQAAVLELLEKTELNAVVIDIKETDGYVNFVDVDIVKQNKTAGAKPQALLNFLQKAKAANVYTIARIVIFRDNLMPRLHPEMAVKNPDGSLWRDRANITWLDPYNDEAKEYMMQIALAVADMGFDEIQFDYIRFPSDGNLSAARYSKPSTRASASNEVVAFLKQANTRLKTKGVKISIDVFGLTTTAVDDMGIGQKIADMTQWVDYVSPMVYPSHYAKGAYGIPDPNKEPYRTVYLAMRGALERVPAHKLRPWLQDFTMRGYHYGPQQVRDQIQASYDNGIGSWLLWNSRCVYTLGALKGPEAENSYERSTRSGAARKKEVKIDQVSVSVSSAPAASDAPLEVSTSTAPQQQAQD